MPFSNDNELVSNSTGGLPSAMRTYINKIPACQNLPEDKRIDGKNKAIAGWRDNKLWWMAMVFESVSCHLCFTNG